MEKKRRRLGVPMVHVSATYKKITVSVPDAPVSEALPATMTFYVDTRFTTAQVNRLRSMILIVLGNWDGHFTELNDGADRSRYQNCVNKYAKFNLAPVWFEEKLTNGASGAGVQMDGFTSQVTANGFGRAAKAYIMYQKSGSSTIKGLNASNPETNSLTVTVNASDLSLTSVTTLFLGGSLFHAWLHREGYRHPAGKYTSYLAGEAAMCVMRGNRDKALQHRKVLIQIIRINIKKALIMVLSPLSRHLKKPSCYHEGSSDTWRGYFLWRKKDKHFRRIPKNSN